MVKLSITVRGLDQFPGGPQVQGAIRAALLLGQRAIVRRAQANLSGRYVRVRSGRLRGGMRTSLAIKGSTFIATVRNVVFYGHILEGGARAHVVPGPLTRQERREGLRQKVLRFEAGGRTVFARSVVIPPLQPRRWFAAAVEEALPELRAAFEQQLGVLTSQSSVRIAS